MKIAVWKTGHPIADTVADALAEGFDGEVRHTSEWDADRHNRVGQINIGYGILRGNGDVFRHCESKKIPWFQVDRGHLNPGHFSGYYRISYRGTQARWHEGIPRKPIDIKFERWRGLDWDKPTLICPPTEPVSKFFGLGSWRDGARALSHLNEKRLVNPREPIWREKGDPTPLNLNEYNYVITFNSSIGWQALQQGISVISSRDHSIVGSYYESKGYYSNITDVQTLMQNLYDMPDTRLELFEAMNAHQFTLEEIRQGKAWPLIEHYLSISGSIAGKPSLPKSAPTPSSAGLKHRFQSTISSTAS